MAANHKKIEEWEKISEHDEVTGFCKHQDLEKTKLSFSIDYILSSCEHQHQNHKQTFCKCGTSNRAELENFVEQKAVVNAMLNHNKSKTENEEIPDDPISNRQRLEIKNHDTSTDPMLIRKRLAATAIGDNAHPKRDFTIHPAFDWLQCSLFKPPKVTRKFMLKTSIKKTSFPLD